MKLLLSFILLTTFSFTSYSHDYYFAFAEMEYNESSKSFELTLIVSTHDTEHWLQNKGVKVNELENIYSDSILNKEVAVTLLKGYTVSLNTSNILFYLSGYEVLNTGLTEFYFKSAPVEISSSLNVKFDLLMDSYPQQQNKLTFIYKAKKQSYSFLNSSKEQIINLQN